MTVRSQQFTGSPGVTASEAPACQPFHVKPTSLVRRIALPALSLGAATVLVACGGGNSAQEATPTSPVSESTADGASEAKDGADVAASEFEEIEATDYRSGPSYLFTYQINGAAKKGECFITETGSGCTGTVAEDVPDVQVPPFEAQRPGAVFANASGPDYGLFEGIPPARKPLQAGQRIVVGDSTCQMTGAKLECWYGQRGDNNGFTITGVDRSITTMKPPTGASFVGGGATSVARDDAQGQRCGTVRSKEFPPFDGATVEILAGDTSCDTAVSIMDEYLNVPADGQHGNANVRTIRGWSCNMPTAATMEATGVAASCTDRGSGAKIGVPVE